MGYVYHRTHGAPINAWTRGVPVDSAALQQLNNIASLPFIYRHVAVTPDVHLGKGATVGRLADIPSIQWPPRHLDLSFPCASWGCWFYRMPAMGCSRTAAATASRNPLVESVHSLVMVATGLIQHRNQGECPDTINPSRLDTTCQACSVIARAHRVLREHYSAVVPGTPTSEIKGTCAK